MKRIFAFLIVSLFTFSIFAVKANDPSDEKSSEEIFRQYQTFSWEAVPKARKYEVVVEEYKDRKWVFEASVQTKKTNAEVLLTPGQKRVSIVSYNLLGKKASTSEWVSFIVLTEMQPYLYDDYLRKSKNWNSPILHATHGTGDENIVDDLEAEIGDPENSFFVKGKNIFFEGTKFSLVPVDRSSSGGKNYQAYITDRKVSPLKIFRRDYDRSGVVVSYNADDLFSGYYKIVAENPGGMQASLDILVFADRDPVFDMSDFNYDETFKVHTFSKSSIEKQRRLVLRGTGFTFDTDFSLVPSDTGIPYPFASSISRERVPLQTISSRSISSKGDLEVNTNLDTSLLRSGYYKLVAESNSGRSEELILLTDEQAELDLPKIKHIKGLADKSDQITFEITGKGFSRTQTLTLISKINEMSGLNDRIPLSTVDLRKGTSKLYVQGNKEKINSGIYALLIEDVELYKKFYIEIDEKYDVKLKNPSDVNVAELFYPSEDFVMPTLVFMSEEIEDVPASPEDLSYSVFDYSVTKKSRKFFPTINGAMIMGSRLLETSNFDLVGFTFSIDLLKLDWFIWDLGAAGQGSIRNGFSPEIVTTFYLTTPLQIFNPFLAFEIGGYYGRGKILSEIVSDYDYKPFGAEIGLFAGAIIFDYFQVSYSFRIFGVNDWLKSQITKTELGKHQTFIYHNVYIGVRFPIRPYSYTRVPKSSLLTVTKGGTVSGMDYSFNSDIKKIVFAYGVKSVEHFKNMEILEQVVLPESLVRIGDYAFYNCSKLKEINIPEGVVEIGPNAFAGCTSLHEIELPSSIRKIDPTAFAGWEKGNKKIIVNWDADDDTVRDLGGLEKYLIFENR